MLLGEAEILGQVREAYLHAHESHVTGPVLNRLFQAALEIGKRVRAETELGTRPMGVASAGMKLAERIFGKLSDRSALVLGAGTISEQVVSQLHDRKIKNLYLSNRSRDKAEEFARQYDGRVMEWGEWDTALKLPDVIVSAVGVQDTLLTKAMIERAMSARGNRALFLMDLGLPRNIEPSTAELYNVYLYTMDDLTEIVNQNRSARQTEVPKAEALVEEHVGKFISWQASVQLIGVLETLRGSLKQKRAAFLHEKLSGMNHFSAEDREQIGSMMDELIEKLLMRRRSGCALKRNIAEASPAAAQRSDSRRFGRGVSNRSPAPYRKRKVVCLAVESVPRQPQSACRLTNREQALFRDIPRVRNHDQQARADRAKNGRQLRLDGSQGGDGNPLD